MIHAGIIHAGFLPNFVRADHREMQELKGGGAPQVWVGRVGVECGSSREAWDLHTAAEIWAG
eukprot:scaffold1967_cov60-Phaeocystis_antarctica.AAC.6